MKVRGPRCRRDDGHLNWHCYIRFVHDSPTVTSDELAVCRTDAQFGPAIGIESCPVSNRAAPAAELMLFGTATGQSHLEMTFSPRCL